MKASFGTDAGERKKGRETQVIWDTSRLVNAHIAMMGMSGAGKTTMIRHTLRSMVDSSTTEMRVHMFDVHGDMGFRGCSTVPFSEQTPYGLNPLRVSPDPHFGGIRKCIQNFIDTVNDVSATPLGSKQESVIRNLLYDLYKSHGFDRDNPSTWDVDEYSNTLIEGGANNRLYLDVPRAEKDDATALGAKWDPQKSLWYVTPEMYKGSVTQWPPKMVGRTHPTVEELVIYAKRVLLQTFLGSDQEAVTRVEIFNKAAQAYQRKALEMAKKNIKDWDDSSLASVVDKAGEKAVLCYANYVESVRTGVELESVMKYDSTEVLKSVVDRLEGLVDTGLFKPHTIPFDPRQSVWHYKLDALRVKEQQMFVLFRLAELWDKAKQRGQSTEVRDVLVLDEFGMYATLAKDPDNIINVLARESRKYGVAIIVAGQNPKGFSEDLMNSIGTTIILGVTETKFAEVSKIMGPPMELLAWIKLKKTLAVHFKETGATKNEWRYVYSPQIVT